MDHPFKKIWTAAVVSMTATNKKILKEIYSDCEDIGLVMRWWDQQVRRGQKFMSISRPWMNYHGGSGVTLAEALERHNGIFADDVLIGSGIMADGQRIINKELA